MTISESNMKIFALFVAVLLSAEAATVPSDVTHTVTVPVPGNILSASKDVDVEVPAVVVEVSKDHKHNPDMMLRLMAMEMENTTGNQGITEVTPKAVEISTTEGSGDSPVVSPVVPLVVSPVDAPVVPAVVSPVVVPVDSAIVPSVDSRVVSPVVAPVVSAVVPPVVSPVVAPVDSRVVSPVASPVVPPIVNPVVPPIVSPIVPPVVAPVDSRAVSPVASPVAPAVDSPVGYPVVPPVVPPVVSPVVSPVVPPIPVVIPTNHIQLPPVVHDVHETKSSEGQIVHMPNEDQELTTEANEAQKIVTVVPMLDDEVTNINDDDTTVKSDTEEVTTDVTTNVAEGEETTVGGTTESMEDTTINPNDAVETTDRINKDEVLIVTPSTSHEDKVKEDSSSSEESKEKTSKENSSNDSSSSEESEEKKHTIVHNHNEEQASVPPVSGSPTIIEDIIPHPADIFASEGDAYSDTVVIRRRRDLGSSKVTATQNLHKDKNPSPSLDKNSQPTESKCPYLRNILAMRRRRAIPFREPTVVIPASGKPKLETNPKVIAEILAKSKNLQKRYKKSIVEEVSTTAVPLIEKIDIADDADMPATIDPCDLLCTKFEFDPVCASNGLCLHEFSNQCILDTFNCKHPKNKFRATKDDRCLMTWLEFCSENEML